MGNETTFDFEHNVDGALADGQLRKNLRNAMDILVDKRRMVFPDADTLEQLRSAGNAIKRRALKQLPRLLEQLEANCTRNGIRVHWAEDTAEATASCWTSCAATMRLRSSRGNRWSPRRCTSIISSRKTASRRWKPIWANSSSSSITKRPLHIIVPAIHKNRDEVAAIFHEKIPDTPYTEDVEELTAIARRVLRKRFATGQGGAFGRQFRHCRNRNPPAGGKRGQRPHVHHRTRRFTWPSWAWKRSSRSFPTYRPCCGC